MSAIEPRIEIFDGIEFEVPVWDPTPVSWSEDGSWAKSERVTECCLASIRSAVPDHEALAAEALTANLDGHLDCGTFWGSHGCSRPVGHPGLHVCGEPGDLCSAGLKYGPGDTFITWWHYLGTPPDELALSSMRWTWFS